MPNNSKVLTAKVKVDTSGAEKKLARLASLIKGINQVSTKSSGVGGLEQGIDKAALAAERLREATAKASLAEEKLAQAKQRTADIADKKLKQEEAAIDRQLKKEDDALKRKVAASFKKMQQEEAAYQKQLQREEALKQKELERERIRQQSLNTLGEGDRAAQKIASTMDRIAREEYEAWWAASLNRAELEKSHPILARISNAWNTIDSKIRQTISGNTRITSAYNTVTSKVQGIVNKVKQWWSNQTKVTSATRGTNNILGSVWSKLKGIAATYLGIMGAKAMINTSDTITSAKNKLNYVNAAQLGSAGYTAGGSEYSNATINATAESMDKMYNSSQRVRMGYDDMMSNVSKSMVLAGDAFGDSIDNAIRFQEIMAEAYAVGGASAQEMASSMYQMIQALGAGALAGDELKSVREGAALAYQKIEEFVQGLYETDESLKDLASQGKVTSDMVVAAVMTAGDELDEAFERTAITFEGAWTQIKNAAIKAFEPVQEKLSKILNDLVDNGLIEKMEKSFTTFSNTLCWALDKVTPAIHWIADNWEWLQWVVIGVIGVIIVYMNRWWLKAVWIIGKWVLKIVWLTVKTVATVLVRVAAYMLEHLWLLVILATVVALIAIFVDWKNGGIDTCTAIQEALLAVAIGIALIGVITGSTSLIIIAIVIALVALIFWKLSEILGGFYWLKAGIGNVWDWIKIAGSACAAWISTAFNNTVNKVVACFMGLSAAARQIGPAISKTFKWIGDKIKYWIGEAIVWCAQKMAELLGSINFGGWAPLGVEILPAFNSSEVFAGAINSLKSITNDADNPGSLGKVWSGVKTAYDAGKQAWLDTHVTKTAQEAWDEEWAKYDPKDLDAAYEEGFQKGEEIKKKLNDWGEQFQTGLGWSDLLNLLGGGDTPPNNEDLTTDALREEMLMRKKLEGDDDNSNKSNGWKIPSNEELLAGIDDLKDGVGGIGSDTGSIAKSMDLAEEDLKYLRALAEKEWKKEYTTASITVDMSNFNTINKDGDLDGIVTKLRDKLYEEMNSLADGVYA